MLFGTGNVTLKGVGMLLVAGENFQISVEGDGNVWTFGCVKIYLRSLRRLRPTGRR